MFFNQFAIIIEYCQIKHVNENDFLTNLWNEPGIFICFCKCVSYYIYVFLHMKIGAGAYTYKTRSIDTPSRTIYLWKYDETLQKVYSNTYYVSTTNKCKSKNNHGKNMCLQNIYVILTPDLSIVITITKTKGDGIEQYKLFRFTF